MSVELILSGLVVFATHVLEAVTGFGCTVLALPFASALLGFERARILLIVLAWVLALYIVVRHFKKINWREFAKIGGLAALGLPAGIFALSVLDKNMLTAVLAAFIVVTSCARLVSMYAEWKREKRENKNSMANDSANRETHSMEERPTPESRTGFKKGIGAEIGYIALLVGGGAIHGAFATGGPLIVVYAAAKLKDKAEFRATLCLLWTVLNTILIAQGAFGGSFGTETVSDIAWMMPFLIAGIIGGEWLHGKANARVFSAVVAGALLATGCVMLASSIPAIITR